MKVIIDRFEGDFAVVETADRIMVNIPKILTPDAEEGDVININIDKNETKNRKKNLEKIIDEIWAD